MVSKKRLRSGDDLSDSDTIGLNGQITPPSHRQSAKSPENLDSNHDAGEETSCMPKTRTKRKATMPSPTPTLDSKRIWSKKDELVILKGIVDYQNETGVEDIPHADALADYIKNDIDCNFSKDQLSSKIRKLKKRFLDHVAKKTCFTNTQDSELFQLSMRIWGKDNAECVNDKANGTKSKSKKRKEAVTNDKPENDDGLAEEGNTCDKESPAENADKQMEDETGVKESEEDEPKTDDGSAKHGSGEERMEEEDGEDELLALKDALETTMFQGFSKYSKKLMLHNLIKLGATEKKELSDEWKALLLQESLLKCKKQFFSGKLGKAICDD